MTSPARETLSVRDRVRDLIYRYGLIAVLIVLVAYFAISEPVFGTLGNVLIILEGVSFTAIIALGVTISLTVDGFDLSVGSNVSFVVMLTVAAQVYWNLGPVLSVVIGLAAGAAIGLINGVLIVIARIPDLLATLGTMFAFAGLSLVITAGQSVAPGAGYNGAPAKGTLSAGFLWLGQGNVLGIPFSIIVMVVLGVVVTVFLARSRPGRILRAIGGNPEASRLAGVHVGRYRMLAYLLSGVLAAVGGILLAGRLGRGDVGVGADYLLETVAASLIGFAVLGANRPNGFGTIFGAVFVGVLLNGLTMQNVPYYLQDFIKGALLVAALVLSFSSLFKRKDAL
jgi:simple sugar transport system permease protein